MKVITGQFLVLFILSLLNAQAQDNQLTKKEQKEGWKLLFDGKTTTGWKGAFIDKFPQKGWMVKNGMLIVEDASGAESTNGGDIVTLNEYSDFELKLDFKLTEGANSGVKYFVAAQQPTPASPRSAFGLEFQLLDDAKHPDAKQGKNGNRTLASLYDLIPAINTKPSKPVGQWNSLRILSQGTQVSHWLNGILVVSYDRSSPSFKSLIAGSKYKDIEGFGLHKAGRILLQDHGNQAFFKNIKIKELKNSDQNKAAILSPQSVGVVSFTFRKSFQKDVAATLDSIKEMGITNIEFSNLFGKKATELRKMLDERGMRCTSFGVNYNDLVNKPRELSKDAVTLGAEFVRVAWIPHDKTTFTLANAEKAVADFNTAGKILKEEFGLTFCYHNHGFDMQPYKEGTFFDYMVANTDPDYVSLELDILWAFHPGHDPVKLLKKYGSRFKLMHLKDLRKGVKGDLTGATPVENNVALGSGQINVPMILKEAQKVGIKYYYIEDESNAVNLQVPVSLSFIKSL